MKVHELKIMPEYYDQVRYGNKRFEFRKNDRDFKVGDILRLKEWDGEKYTGEEIDASVRFILHQFPGMERGYCVLSIDTMMHYIPRKNGEWIPVSERLPEERHSVLVYCPEYRNIFCAYYYKDEWLFFGGGCKPIDEKVSHWMVLPESPIEDGDRE